MITNGIAVVHEIQKRNATRVHSRESGAKKSNL